MDSVETRRGDVVGGMNGVTHKVWAVEW